MDVYVCWDGDKIGRRVGRAVLRDDVGEVRQVDQAINAGNELWRSLALSVGGSVIEIGGDEGRIVIDASHLGKIPGIAENYSETVGATVSVGVGKKLSESAMALVIAKLRGGDQIVIWDQSMQAEYDEVANAPKSEREKISDEYLAKAANETHKGKGFEQKKGPKNKSAGGNIDQLVMEHNTKKLTGANAGFAVQHKPNFTTLKSGKPGDSQPGPDPAPPAQSTEQASTGSDFESQLHDAAQAQQSKDDDDQKQAGDNAEDLKKKLAQTLAKIKKQMPVLVQLQQTAPDAYQAVLDLVHGVILLGKEVMSQNPPPSDVLPDHVQNALGKAEELSKALSEVPGKFLSQKLSPVSGKPGVKTFTTHTDYSHMLPEEHQKAGLKMTVEHTRTMPAPAGGEMIRAIVTHPMGHHIGYVTAHVTPPAKSRSGVKAIEPHSDLDSRYRGKGIGSAMYEASYVHAKTQGINRVEGGFHSEDAHKVHKRLADKHGFRYRAWGKWANNEDDVVAKFPYTGYGYDLASKQAPAPAAEAVQKDEMGETEPAWEDEHHFGMRTGLAFHRDVELDKGGGYDSGFQSSPPSGGEMGMAEKHERQMNHVADLPVGTIDQSEVKVRHADGKESWKEVHAGMIQAQDQGAPLFGANSHPTSSREPGAR